MNSCGIKAGPAAPEMVVDHACTRMIDNQKFRPAFPLATGELGPEICGKSTCMAPPSSSSALHRHASLGMSLLLVGLHAGPVMLAWYCGWPWAVAGLLAVGIGIASGTLLPHSCLFGVATRSFPSEAREVILTIDDGPSADTDEMLRILASHRSRAVFFLIGDRAICRPDDVRRMVAAGHLIGNHTQTHPAYRYWSYPPWLQRRELDQCQRTLTSIIGLVPRLFRAPAGLRNPYCHLIAAEFSLEVVGWKARGFDGVNTPIEKIIATIRRQLSPGAIVLLHQGLPHSPEVLRRVLQMLDEDGWTTTLPESWLSPARASGIPPASC